MAVSSWNQGKSDGRAITMAEWSPNIFCQIIPYYICNQKTKQKNMIKKSFLICLLIIWKTITIKFALARCNHKKYKNRLIHFRVPQLSLSFCFFQNFFARRISIQKIQNFIDFIRKQK